MVVLGGVAVSYVGGAPVRAPTWVGRESRREDSAREYVKERERGGEGRAVIFDPPLFSFRLIGWVL